MATLSGFFAAVCLITSYVLGGRLRSDSGTFSRASISFMVLTGFIVNLLDFVDLVVDML
jgi:hypothetical protein